MVRLGAEAGLGREWGPPTQETSLRKPCKPLHDLDGIPQLHRALQLGLTWVGCWQVAIAGQPVLGHRREWVKWEGSEGWDSVFPIPSSKPHLSPGIRNPGPPSPMCLFAPPASRSWPSRRGFASLYLAQRVLVPTSPPQSLSRSSDPDAQNLTDAKIWVPGPHAHHSLDI